MMRSLLLAALVFLIGAAGLRAATQIRVEEPRSFGYFLGDVLQRDIIVRIPSGDSLDPASVPLAGPVNYWLELSRVDVASEDVDDGTEYRVSLRYQTFYAPLDPRYLAIPGFTLKVTRAGGGTEDVSVPEFDFLTSPIRQLFADQSQSSQTNTELQPDVPASRLPTGDLRTALLASGVVFLLTGLALAWHNAWWPFRTRPARPFTEAARYLNSHATSLADAAGYRLALLKLHRAFDLAAGRRVLADDVEAFLRDHPEFGPHRADVEQMFASSRQAFFANDVEQARSLMSVSALAKLSSALGAAERRAA
jgi:mxaA protein